MRAVVVVLAALATCAWLTLEARIGLVAARMLQIEEYETRRFLVWGRTRAWLAHPAAQVSVPFAAAGVAGGMAGGQHAALIAAAAWLAAAMAGNVRWRWTDAKRPLVYTARMRRLLGAAGIIAAVAAAGAALLIASGQPLAGSILALVISAGAPASAQLFIVTGNAAAAPVERQVRQHYLQRARRHLGAVDPLVIAVTGSYGKTSTKQILAQLLSDDAHVLATRKSFNTLMGITRVINEDLMPDHRIFIVEMDAYGPGEIAAMCALVKPRYAILTSVGPQHLERFGSMERIGAALYEAVASLPGAGVAVVHTGDEGGTDIAARALADGRRVVRYGLSDSGADVVTSDIHIDGRGTRFDWRWTAERLHSAVSLPLLGAHQALNMSAALAVVHLLGRDVDAAVTAARTLRPVDHRLQPLQTGGPISVIDDSYNANPVGVHSALDVLAAMDGGVRILVTPGLVELGSVEEAENRRYGVHAGAVCDHVIVVEARPAAALMAGLRDSGIAVDRVHLVRSLREATEVISRIASAGDVVLFANDLPDTYLPGPGARLAGTAASPGR